MVFSTDNLYKQENINSTPIKNTVIKISERTSLVIEALKYIIEEERLIAEEVSKYNVSAYNEKRKLIHLNEAELNINVNVNGPFNKLGAKLKSKANDLYQYMKTNFTIENIVKFIIKSFRTIISRIWREFEALCMSICSKNSQIKRLENKIQNIGVNYKVDFPIYNYTHITNDKSEVELEESLDHIYEEIETFLNSFSKLKNSATEIENAINSFNQDRNDDEFREDLIRAGLVGSNSPIDAESFADVLFKYFRDNSSSAILSLTLTPDDIRKRLKSWNIMPKVIKLYGRDKDKLEKAGDKLVDKVQKNKLDKYLTSIPATTLDLYSNLITRYSARIKNTCQIYLIYFANRLEAAKEELSTNTRILNDIAKFIVREGL